MSKSGCRSGVCSQAYREQHRNSARMLAEDAKCGILDTGILFLAGFVISKNRAAREHENESMGE